MADNRKYYYLKLKENYFDDDAVVLLESMPGGEIYSNMLLKLYLRSLKNDGLLRTSEGLPYTAQMLATITRQREQTVRSALALYTKLGLMTPLPDGTMYMNNIELFVGKSSTEADRKRKAQKKLTANPRLPGPEIFPPYSPEISPPYSAEISPPYSAEKIPPYSPEKIPPFPVSEVCKNPENPPVSMTFGTLPTAEKNPPEIEKELEKEKERECAPAPGYGRFQNVTLSDRELALLKKELPQKWQYYIERLSSHMASTGKKYRSHLATLLKWAQEDGGKQSLPSYTYQEGESL